MTEQVSIYGYRWFGGSKDPNTYHTVIVYADGKEVFRSTKSEYGYGEQYQETGLREFLKAIGESYPPNRLGYDHWPVNAHEYFDDRGIHYNTEAYDVKREQELFAFQPFGGQVRRSGNTLP
ncbi:hypothetical protein [Nocardia jiangxiensis]|uniref:hypothetical protein n=1 Tax=Nocardia jiangxiensis TaxID=282685 RepID=UPI0002FE5EF5|nr:hypothetical protein [Nocardia jiangxiensis]